MRLIKTFSEARSAGNFTLFLQQKGVDSFQDQTFNEKLKIILYQVWVYDEDKIDLAEKLFSQFETANDNNQQMPAEESFFQPQLKKQKLESDLDKNSAHASDNTTNANNKINGRGKKMMFHRSFHSHRLTSFFLLLCVAIFTLNYYQEQQIKKAYPKLTYILLTPTISALLFDVPYALIQYDALVKQYYVDLRQPIDKQPSEFLKAIKQVEDKPYWMGLDELIKDKIKGDPINFKKMKLFEKIRQGEIWRFFSPAFLHKDFLHLLFNMLWLWILGRPIEERIRFRRYLVLTLALAAFTNLCQYLVSGPNFLGYSGIVMGLVGFIWMRQKIAPWEGYVLQKTTFLFLGAYVFLMLMLSLASFFSRVMGSSWFAVNIANTAHISGALFGAFLARYFSFFKEQT